MADTSRPSIFDKDKRYMAPIWQQGRIVFDWDRTESFEEVYWWLINYFNFLVNDDGAPTVPSTVRVVRDWPITQENTGFSPVADSLVNNFRLSYGMALSNGRAVIIPSSSPLPLYDESGEASYADPVNYLFKGIVTGITENVATSDYDIIDTSRNFRSQHGLQNCRIMFTSGAEDGNIFDIDSRTDSTTLNVLDDLSSVAATDTYVIYPPALSLPAAFSVNLITWMDEVTKESDPDLEDPVAISGADAIVTRELRWCVYADAGTGTSGNDTFDDVFSSTICTIIVPAGTTVEENHINDAYSASYVGTNHVLSMGAAASLAEYISAFIRDQDLVVQKEFTTIDYSGADFTVQQGGFKGGALEADSTSRWLNTVAAQTFDNSDGANQHGLGDNIHLIKDFDAGTLTFDSDTDATNTTIKENDLVIGIAAADAAFDIQRSMNMGYIPIKQGLDWNIDFTLGITVFPGQVQIGSRMFQVPGQVAASAIDGALWIGGLPGAGEGWVYIYALLDRDPNQGRDLVGTGLRFSLTTPNWSGFHPEGGTDDLLYCIGMTYYFFDATDKVRPAVCKDNAVYFTDDLDFYLDQEVGSALASTDATTIQPPKGATSMDLELIYENTSTSGINADKEYRVEWQKDAVKIWGQTIFYTVANDGVDGSKFSEVITVPCSHGDTFLRTFIEDDVTATATLKPKVVRFSSTYMPDETEWTL